MKFKILFFLSFCFLLTNCNTKKKKHPNQKISNDFKINFLKKVLLDTVHFNFLPSKNHFVSNYPLLPPSSLYYLDSISNKYKKAENQIDFISKILNEEQSKFIECQIKNNKSLDLNQLSKFDIKILDVKKYYKDGISRDSIDKIVYDYYNNKDSFNFKNKSYLIISKPIFNKEKNLAYIRILYGSSGASYLLENSNKKWYILKEFENWVE